MAGEPPRGRRSLDLLLLAQLTLVSLSMLLLAEWGSHSNEAVASEETLSWLFTFHVIWAFASWRYVTGRFLDGYTLFLLSTILFCGGQIVLSCLGLLPEGLLGGTFGALTTRRTIALVNACVSSMHMGALFMAARSRSRAPPPDLDLMRGDRVGRFRKVGVALLAISAVPMLMRSVDTISIVIQSGYFGLYQQEAKTGLNNWDAIVASFFLPGVLILFATSAGRKGWIRLSWTLGALNTFINIFLGARAAAFMSLLPMLLLHHELVSHIKLRWGVLLAICGLVVIPLLAQTRIMNLQDRLASSASGRPTDESLLLSGVIEMGGSMRTIAHSVELVPETRGFDNGAGYARALLTVMPNLLWDIHPALRSGLYSQWLMQQVDPGLYLLGGGIGYSMIAEAYVNASWEGAPVILLVIGLLVGGMVVWSRSRGGVIPLAVEAIVVSVILVLPRSETGTIVRPVVWAALLPYILVGLKSNLRRLPPRKPQRLGQSPIPPERGSVI